MIEYLVEVAQGYEVVYRTPLALRAAMQSGEITADSRIYHRAAARWISIVEHPEYRRFLAERRPPDWLEPIPFEPAPPESDPAGPPRSLTALWRRAGSWLRARRTRRKPAPTPKLGAERPPGRSRRGPPPAGSASAGEESFSADPADRRWTFY